MTTNNKQTEKVKDFFANIRAYGPYSVFAAKYKGGPKNRYIATVFNEAILPYFQDAKKLKALDFGCGSGILSNRLASLTDTTIGVDISPAMLDMAKEGMITGNKEVAYMQIDGERLPFKNRIFDAAIARGTLCLVSEECLHDVLSEINRVLNSGGHFYLLEQVSDSPYWRTEGELSIRRSISEIMEKTKGIGFKCIESHVVRKPRFPWIYLFWFRLLPKMFILPLAKLEIKFNKRFRKLETNRWHDALFIFKKVSS